MSVTILLDKAAMAEARALPLSVTVYIDRHPRIAHNKVMIFDDRLVETGSYNYTANPRDHNAENMLFINNQALAEAYLANFKYRMALSTLDATYTVN